MTLQNSYEWRQIAPKLTNEWELYTLIIYDSDDIIAIADSEEQRGSNIATSIAVS